MIEQKETYSYEERDFFALFPKRKQDSNKGDYGKVGVIAGGKGMAGAAFLCARAAYAVGAGLVRIYTHESNRVILQQLLPEAIVITYEEFDRDGVIQFLASSDVIAIGCGLGQDEIATNIVQTTINHVRTACVVDADALNILAKDVKLLEQCNKEMIFTPHMKEMSRILQCDVTELQEERQSQLESFVKTHKVTCVLKDAKTLVCSDKYALFVNTTGNPAMSKGGSGDVLAGMIAGILGQKASVHDAACLGVYLHGKAGDVAKKRLGYYSVLARDIIDAISEILKKIEL